MEKIPLRPDGLQIEEDRVFQERYWTIERAAWAAFTFILVLAAAGFTGSGGPASVAEDYVGTARVTYPAVARWVTPSTLQVHFNASESGNIRFGPRFLSAFEVQNVQPEPISASVGSDGLTLQFEVTGTRPAPVEISIEPQRVGWVRFDVSVDGSESVTLSTVLMP